MRSRGELYNPKLYGILAWGLSHQEKWGEGWLLIVWVMLALGGGQQGVKGVGLEQPWPLCGEWSPRASELRRGLQPWPGSCGILPAC